jgi:hypothetical protein
MIYVLNKLNGLVFYLKNFQCIYLQLDECNIASWLI